MKKTPEEKKAEKLAKKQAAKEKKAAKKAAMLEKKRAKAALKKQKREEKKAKKAALREKQKAKKLALKEKERAKKLKLKAKADAAKAKERAKKLALKEKAKAEKAKLKNAKVDNKDNGNLDPKTVAKSMKTILGNIANEMVDFDNVPDKTIKWFSNMGYDISITPDGKFVSVAFIASKTKKLKIAKSNVKNEPIVEPEPKAVAIADDEPEEPKVELVPAGDLLGTDGNVDTAEVANIEDDGNANDIIDDEFEDDDDDTIADSRDEQDEDLVDNRREFFNNYGDDFEPNDD